MHIIPAHTIMVVTGPRGCHSWMERQADGRFVLCTLSEVMTAKMDVASIPAAGEAAPSATGDAPVRFVCTSGAPLAALEADRIMRINFGE